MTPHPLSPVHPDPGRDPRDPPRFGTGAYTVDRAADLQQLWPGADFRQLATPFRAVVLRRVLPTMVVEGIDADAYECVRSPEAVRSRPNDLLAINAVLLGDLEMSGPETRFVAHPGDVFLQRSSSFSFQVTPRNRTFRVLVPMATIAPAMAQQFYPLALCTRTVLTAAFLRLASEVLRSATGSDAILQRSEQPLEQALLVLARAVLDEVVDQQTGELPAPRALHLAALDHIGRNLEDAGLTPRSVAAALSISVRTLYAAFSGEPESIAATIRRLRVEAATELLLQDPTASPSRLARTFGFASADTFARAFARHHETTLRAYRQALLEDPQGG